MPPYTKNVWADNDPTKPLSAARLGAMETGIERASPVAVSSTSLPGAPYDGQEIFYAADATNGIYWHLRWRSASASAHKWEFLGGAPLHASVATSQTTTSSTYVDLATAGPSVTAPLAGDYLIAFGATMQVAVGGTVLAAVKLGAAATSDNDAIRSQPINLETSGWRQYIRTGLAASAVLKVQYRSSTSNTATIQHRDLLVWPVRVS